MSLIHHQPWGSLALLQDEIGKYFENQFKQSKNDESNVVTSSWIPTIDIREEADKFVLLADIPGVDPKDIEISMEKGVLTIKGEKKNRHLTEGTNYTRVERFEGVFYRRFSLPDTANSEGIKAVGKHGVLEITIPKTEKAQPRRITVEDKNG